MVIFNKKESWIDLKQKMEELIIHKFEAEQIEDTLRIVANILGSRKVEGQTCADRQVMKSIKMIKRVLAKTPYK